jgi:hypothetical protein
MKWRRRPKPAASAGGANPGPDPTRDAGETGEDADAGLRRRVGALFTEAQVLMLNGRPGEGVALQQEARRLMYDLIERNPADRAAKEMLGCARSAPPSSTAGAPESRTACRADGTRATAPAPAPAPDRCTGTRQMHAGPDSRQTHAGPAPTDTRRPGEQVHGAWEHLTASLPDA